MFDRSYIRTYLSLAWILAFVGMWIMLQYVFLDKEELTQIIIDLETSVSQENWEGALVQADRLETAWQKQRFFVQVTNGEAEASSFSQKLRAARELIESRETIVVGHLGELHDLAESIAVVFPGP